MNKLVRELLKTTAGLFSGALLVFITDKLGDLVINVLSEGRMTFEKLILLVALLCLVFLLFAGIQSSWSVVKILKKRLTGKTRIEELERKMEETKTEMFLSFKKMQSNKQLFNNTVDDVQIRVLDLSVDEINFQGEKTLIAEKILDFKEIYQSNISDIEKFLNKAYKDIDDAERIFMESRDWSSKTAKKYFHR